MFKLLTVPMQALQELPPPSPSERLSDNAKRAPRGALCDAYSRIEKTASN